MKGYAKLLRLPTIRLLLGSAFFSRLPLAMEGLAILLFAQHETHSLSAAGAVAAGFAVGIGASAPFKGRYMDRAGLRVIPVLAGAHVALLQAVVIASIAGAPVFVIVCCAAAAGTSLPMAGAVVSAMLMAHTGSDKDLRTSAFALDAALTEAAFLLGPLLTTAITAWMSARLALTAASVVLFSAGVVLTVSQRTKPRQDRPGDRLGVVGVLRVPIVRWIVLALFPLGVCLGCAELALLAFAAEHGAISAGGLLITLFGVGGAVGSLLVPQISRRHATADTFRRATFLAPLGPLMLFAVPSVAVMLVGALGAGALTALAVTAGDQLLAENLPEGGGIESMTWLMTTLTVGTAVGNAIGGLAVGYGGSTSAIGAAAASAGVTAIGAILWTRRRARSGASLRPAADLETRP